MKLRFRRSNHWTVLAACLLLSAWFANEARPTGAEVEVRASGGVSAPVPASFQTIAPALDDRALLDLPPPAVSGGLELELPEVDALMTKAIRSGRTPGAVVLVGRRDGVVFRRAYGRRSLIPERQEMTVDTIFDLASLTKPMVVGTLAQWLVEKGRLELRAPAVKYLPEFGVREKYLVTVEQLLLHTSGLPPTNSLNDFKHGPERARALTLGGYLYKYPGREFIYSDIGYIALGELIENVTGERLDQTAARVLWKPLGMRDTRYCPTLCEDPRIAPTELNYGWKKNPIRGEPSDTRVHRLGGIAGNAGLFSTADDVARFARMVLGAGELDGVRVLSAERVADMTRPRAVPKATRTLGWDVSSGFSSGRGHELSPHAFGHGGYTGTSLWIDPALNLFIVFLSNRNHPYSTGRVTDLQGQVANAAVRALYPGGRNSATRDPAARDIESVATHASTAADPSGCSQPDAPCSTREALHVAGG